MYVQYSQYYNVSILLLTFGQIRRLVHNYYQPRQDKGTALLNNAKPSTDSKMQSAFGPRSTIVSEKSEVTSSVKSFSPIVRIAIRMKVS
jgi:hypothetical protein